MLSIQLGVFGAPGSGFSKLVALCWHFEQVPYLLQASDQALLGIVGDIGCRNRKDEPNFCLSTDDLHTLISRLDQQLQKKTFDFVFLKYVVKVLGFLISVVAMPMLT
jgi:hypothetical protein